MRNIIFVAIGGLIASLILWYILFPFFPPQKPNDKKAAFVSKKESYEAEIRKYRELTSELRNKINTLETQLKEKKAVVVSQQKSYEAEIKKNRELISEQRSQIKDQANEIIQLNKKLVQEINRKVDTERNDSHIRSLNDKRNNLRPSKIHRLPTKGRIIKIHINDFTFEAIGCKRAGANVYCKFRVTNNSQRDKLLIIGGAGYISRPSYLYDNQGNQYKATEVQFGSNSGRNDAGQTLAPSLPVIGLIKFENIPVIGEEVTVRIGSTLGRWGGGPYITPVIRNIPLSE